jgi:rhomboid family GlyGly-CTERM serine protease
MGSPGPVNHVHRVLKSLNCDGAMGLTLALLCAAMLLLAFTGEGGRLALRYDRSAVAGGEGWRLVTAHLIHLNLRHALLNCLGLALMWALFARDYSLRQWLVIVAAAAAAIDAGLWLCDSTVEWYVGSSGVLHGIMAAGTLAQLRRREATGWVLLGFLALKLAYEHWVGALPLAGSAVVVDAHLFGVLGGGVAAAFLKPRSAPL